jgi:hypothetical protein
MILEEKGGDKMDTSSSQDVAGFESIFDSQSGSSQQEQFVDSWDDCYDCDYNCEEGS